MAHYSADALARQIARKGEPIVFRRVPFSGPEVAFPTFALVRGYRPEELNAGITMSHRLVILAGEPFVREGVEPEKGDAIDVGGRRRHTVEAVGLFRVGSELVRVELQVAGP